MRRKDADFRYLLDLEIGYVDGRVVLPVGIVQGQKLLMLMRRLTISTWDVQNFDQLPIPFRAVAADIVTGEKVVFDRGDLALAIRSSMSVPGAFAPVRVDVTFQYASGYMHRVVFEPPPGANLAEFAKSIMRVVPRGPDAGRQPDQPKA